MKNWIVIFVAAIAASAQASPNNLQGLQHSQVRSSMALGGKFAGITPQIMGKWERMPIESGDEGLPKKGWPFSGGVADNAPKWERMPFVCGNEVPSPKGWPRTDGGNVRPITPYDAWPVGGWDTQGTPLQQMLKHMKAQQRGGGSSKRPMENYFGKGLLNPTPEGTKPDGDQWDYRAPVSGDKRLMAMSMSQRAGDGDNYDNALGNAEKNPTTPKKEAEIIKTEREIHKQLLDYKPVPSSTMDEVWNSAYPKK